MTPTVAFSVLLALCAIALAVPAFLDLIRTLMEDTDDE